MFGSLGHSAPPGAPGWQRRPLLAGVLILVVALVVGEIVDEVVDSYTPAAQRAAASWAAAISPIVTGSGELAVPLARFRDDADSTDRLQVVSLVTTIVSDAEEQRSAYGAVTIPAPDPSDATLADALVTQRAAAATEVAGAFSAATDAEVPSSTAAARFCAAAAAMSVADRDYRVLRGSLRRDDRIELPDVPVWEQDASLWSPAGCARFAAALAANPALATNGRLALVAISLDPVPVHLNGLPAASTTVPVTTFVGAAPTSTTLVPLLGGTGTTVVSTTVPTTTLPSSTVPTTLPAIGPQIPPPSAMSCLPPTDSVTVGAVVANAGNVDATGVVVSASLVASGATAASQAARKVVSILIGDAVYVSLGPLPVSARVATYTLTVTAARSHGTGVSATLTLSTTC